ELLVDGALVVAGTSNDYVAFTSEGTWSGIHVRTGGTATIAFMDLRRAVTGLQLDSDGTVANSYLGAQTGVLIKGGTANISRTTVSGGDTGLDIEGGTTHVDHALITGAASRGIFLGYG